MLPLEQWRTMTQGRLWLINFMASAYEHE